MNLPYLAVLWNPCDPAQAQYSTRLLDMVPHRSWQPTLRRVGMAVYTQPCPVPYLQAHPLHAHSGILLGIVFCRSQSRPLSASALHSDPQLADTSPATLQHLTRHYWGGYIALLGNNRGEWWVMRDCSGMIPCYYTTIFGITLISSDARSFLLFNTLPDELDSRLSFDVNWRYLAGFLAHSQMQIRETAVNNIYELMAGETLSNFSGRISVDITWNPATFSEAGPWESLDVRANSLHETVQNCIDAWASAHEWVVHSLSGGFDSSLVLALLNRSPKRPHVVCVNRYSSGPGEDERYYARLAAEAAHTPLVEWPWEFGDRVLDESLIALPVGAKPSITALISHLEAPFFARLAAAHRIDAIWTGEGGDHVFLALNTALTVVDFVRTRGFRGDLLDVLRNTAHLTRQSIPRLALHAFHQLIRSTPRDVLGPLLDSSLLAKPIRHSRDLLDFIQHPWTLATAQVSPGKRQQIILLADVLHRLRAIPGTQECIELQPLLSQPIIEHCLRIPTFELLCDGTTRGLARRAFAVDIPAEIRNRELKGQTTHHALGLIRRSLPFLSELLLDGALTRRGLLDRSALEPLLTAESPLSGPTLFALLACVAAETWLHAWTARRIPDHAGPCCAEIRRHPTSL